MPHPYKRISIQERGIIVGRYLAGDTPKKISEARGVPSGRVYAYIKKYETEHSLDDHPKPGRPSNYDDRDKRAVLRDITNHPWTGPSTIANRQVKPMSRSTVQRIADKEKIHRRKARKKPVLSDQSKKVRLAWANEHVGWTEEDWKKVIWTDEATVERGEIKHDSWVWRKPKQECDDDKIVSTYKSARFSVCIWGAIEWDKKLSLIILDLPGPKKVNGKVVDKGGFTGERYIEQVLTKVGYNLWTRKMMNEGGALWLEDNSPVHKSTVVKKWRVENPMRLLEHPPYSPDLNPTEYCWAYLKRQLQRYPRIPANKKELNEALQREWEKMPNSEIEKFTHSMHDRCQAIIDARGGHTRY